MAASVASAGFHVAVEKILNSWTVLQLAVQHGFGGADSESKGRWLGGAIVEWFQENKGLESYEVEDFLADILDSEFNTVADDGSLSVVSQGICECYDLSSRGDEAGVMARLARLPKPDLQRCHGTTDDTEAEDQAEDRNDAMDCAEQPPPLVPINNSQPLLSNAGETIGDAGAENMEEEEGWTTVPKKGKQR